MPKTKKLVRDVMTAEPLSLEATASVRDAAVAMRGAEIGDVIVLEDERSVCGIVTDRDLVVRALAEDMDPKSTTLGDICSQDLTTVAPDATIDAAVDLMREKAIRRLPVIEDGRAVGIVSIGDLATQRDPTSALADISAAPANT